MQGDDTVGVRGHGRLRVAAVIVQCVLRDAKAVRLRGEGGVLLRPGVRVGRDSCAVHHRNPPGPLRLPGNECVQGHRGVQGSNL